MVATIRTTRDDVFIVRGSGNASTDNSRVASAVAAANALGRGTIIFDGQGFGNVVNITALHTFTAPIGLECVPGTYVVRNAGSGFLYGSAYVPWSMGGTGTASNLSAGADTLVNPTISLAVGDYVAIWGANALTDITPHGASITHRPMEFHKVSRQVITAGGSTINSWLLGDTVDDPITTVEIVKIPVIRGIRIRNFRMKMVSGVTNTDFGASITFGGCVDVELYNVVLGDPFPGQLNFQMCADVRRTGIIIGDLEFPNVDMAYTNYGIVDTTVNRMTTSDCSFGAVRHGYTSGGRERTISSVDYRYGGPKNILFSNCRFNTNGRQIVASAAFTSQPMLDFHAEGRNITVEGCEFTTPGGGAHTAIQGRCRDLTVRNSTFKSANGTYPVIIRGTNQTYQGNTFKGGLHIIQDGASVQPNIDNTRFIDNTFINMQGACVKITTGTGHEFLNNKFFNCSATPVGSPFAPKAPIYIESLTDSNSTVRIAGNTIPKFSNDFAVYTSSLTASQIIYQYNITPGYSNCAIGLDRTRTATAELELRYGFLNGLQKVATISQTSHGLTTAAIGAPITSNHEVYDDTVEGEAIIGILADVIDANTYCLWLPGQVFEIPPAKISGTYSIGGNGRNLYWDTSDSGRYKASKPGDSAADAPICLVVNSYSATALQVRIPVSSSGGGASTFEWATIEW